MDYQTAHKLFEYNEAMGRLVWKVTNSNRAKAGSPAGTIRKDGYCRIKACGEFLYAHRIIWLMEYGEWPELEIDHIDGDPLNNCITNLRSVTHIENMRNVRRQKNNTSKVTGIVWADREKKWSARINIKGKNVSCGYFIDWFDAVCARKSAEIIYGFHANHGRAI